MRHSARLSSALTGALLCAALTVGGAWASLPAAPDSGVALAAAQNVYAAVGVGHDPRRIYLTDEEGKVSHVSGDRGSLPWSVDVTYSLNGPAVDAGTITGASGLVGIHIAVRANGTAKKSVSKQANGTVPIVVFTIPSHVADDITANDGAIVESQGQQTVVAAVGHAGSGLELNCYLDATKFEISTIAVAAVPADNTADDASAAASDRITAVSRLADSAGTLVDSLTDAGSGEHAELIDKLKALRDNERRLGETTIAAREPAHTQAFDDYMKAYVSSYTNHLSGSIGTSTQLTALIGTAGELSGDTPLAQAVVDLAQTTNDLSAAYRHVGAADAIDTLIQRIEQRGTTGLADELDTLIADDAAKGSKDWTAGQNQLSGAMIPYSMAYTDAYTAALSTLTGGGSAGASAYIDQAIGNIGDGGDLKADKQKVDVAMDALAEASKLSGASQALQQIELRFSEQFASSGSADSADSADSAESDTGVVTDGTAGARTFADPQAQSLAGQAYAQRVRQRQQTQRKRAAAAQRQSQQDDHSGVLESLVTDTVQMSDADIMSFAGSATSALGGGSKTTTDSKDKSGNDADDGAAKDSAKGDAAGGADDGTGSDSATEDPASDIILPSIYGLASSDTSLKADLSPLITETVDIGKAGDILAQGIALLAGHTDATRISSPASSSGPAYLLAIRTS